MNQPSAPKREFVIGSDWITSAAMAAFLLLALVSIASDLRHVAQGEFMERVSIQTVIWAMVVFALAFSSVDRLLRVGLVLLGVAAIIRASVFYLHASVTAGRIAAMASTGIDIIGWAAVGVSAGQWFRYVVHVRINGESS